MQLSLGTQKAFGKWTLFIVSKGKTVAIAVSSKRAAELIAMGIPTQG
jgi:hypothetical protein